jgi:hypothetical protein
MRTTAMCGEARIEEKKRAHIEVSDGYNSSGKRDVHRGGGYKISKGKMVGSSANLN